MAINTTGSCNPPFSFHHRLKYRRMLLKLVTGNGERGTGNGERGTGNGERGTGNGERGTGNGERGTGNGERGTGNGERGTGNGKRGKGVWERVYSGNPLENSKWRRKQRLQTLILFCYSFSRDKRTFKALFPSRGLSQYSVFSIFICHKGYKR